MLKNYPLSFSKAITTLLVTLTLAVSCTKGYEPGNVFVEKSALLTGQPGAVNWILTNIRVNNTLDSSARGAQKVYRPDGTFVDDLGFTGYWTLHSRDSLIESTRSSVNPNAPYFTNHFHIDRLDKGGLRLTYTEGDKKIRFEYVANK